jgi:hypothetical protein
MLQFRLVEVSCCDLHRSFGNSDTRRRLTHRITTYIRRANAPPLRCRKNCRSDAPSIAGDFVNSSYSAYLSRIQRSDKRTRTADLLITSEK